MKQQDTAALLSWMQGVDGRVLTDLSVAAWAEVLGPDITYEEARVAAVEHYETEGKYCMPADVIRLVNDKRREDRMAREQAAFRFQMKLDWCQRAGVTVEEYDRHLVAGDHEWIREHDQKLQQLED
jgi:hypothetical protein